MVITVLLDVISDNSKYKAGANRDNILANTASQHLLANMLSRFAMATNILALIMLANIY